MSDNSANHVLSIINRLKLYTTQKLASVERTLVKLISIIGILLKAQIGYNMIELYGNLGGNINTFNYG